MKEKDKQEIHIIFQKMKNDKETYFNKLYEKYKTLIYAIAFSILKNKEDSEEIVQKVYIKIWKMKNDNLPKENETSWLYVLTKNEAIDLLKSKKEMINIDELYYITKQSDELNEVTDRDSYNRIMAKLNSQEQEIVSLKIISNLSFKQISQILDMPESTVKWKYYKSVKTLKILLGNLGMFIITFTIGLKTALSGYKKSSQLGNENIEETIIPDTTSTSSENTDEKENIKDQNSKNEIHNEVQNESTEQVIVQENQNINNAFPIGMLGLSSIFLIVTIIFSIILAKHQLKLKHKSSK